MVQNAFMPLASLFGSLAFPFLANRGFYSRPFAWEDFKCSPDGKRSAACCYSSI